MVTPSPQRAVIFVDGNNLYHGMKQLNLVTGGLNFAKVAQKAVGPRTWVELRYYVGQVPNTGNTKLYDDQRRFLAKLAAQDARISIHLGRLERREERSDAAAALVQYVSNLKVRIDPQVRTELLALGKQHAKVSYMVEKAVDVMLATDLVILAEQNALDAAYIFSADGDYTPAVQFARGKGKDVFAASPRNGAEIAKVVKSFIRIDEAWLRHCYDLATQRSRTGTLRKHSALTMAVEGFTLTFMPIALDTTSALNAIRTSHFIWVKKDDAANVLKLLPRGWVGGFPEQIVNGELAVLFKHPEREAQFHCCFRLRCVAR